MKIETSIKPRRDGTVKVDTPDGVVVFRQDEFGVMAADVESAQAQAFLLSRADDFIPADDADFEVANSLLTQGTGGGDDGGDDDDDYDDDPDDDDDEADEADPNAAPIEEPASVVAAPAPAVAAKRGKKKAGQG